MRIDKMRQLVNVGDVMTQKRVGYNVAAQVKARLSDYMAEVNDELGIMYAAGGRGTGDEIMHYPLVTLVSPTHSMRPTRLTGSLATARPRHRSPTSWALL